MPRDIPVANDMLLVSFDREYRIRDIYFPHVGKENHSQGRPFRFGVWVDGDFSWVGSSWELSLGYLPDTLVTDVVARKEELGIELLCNDLVDFHENIYLRRVRVRNLLAREREVRLFFHQNFSISESEVGDTANYDPHSGAVVHYKGPRYFMVNLCTQRACGVQEYTTGARELDGDGGSWLDAEDGLLSGNPIAQGSVDSVVGVRLRVGSGAEEEVYYWIAMGKSHREVRLLNQLVRDKTPATLFTRTRDYWQLWANVKETRIDLLPERIAGLYKRSLLVIRSQVDAGGAIIAANDSDVIAFNRDTYSYVWPRDGALVAFALDKAGYLELSKRFFFFLRGVIEDEGYFLHKYNPDGSPASSWHPWVKDGKPQLPIQEDQTALVIWALWNHFKRFHNIEFIKGLYRPVIMKAAEFMAGYRDEVTGLPNPSYDLWEERQGILSFTVSTVYAGLAAAAKFAYAFGESHLAIRYLRACREIKEGMDKYLYREELGRFVRMIVPKEDGFEVDETLDASLCGLFQFGPYQAWDPRIVNTMQAVRDNLWLKTKVGGMARYQGDSYYRVADDGDTLPGNPWFICTLWWAEFLIARAKSKEQLAEPLEIFHWVAEHALPSGILSEQLNPYTSEPVSVSPLTWSHAAFVVAVIHYLEKLAELEHCPTCDNPLHPSQQDIIQTTLQQVEEECQKRLED
ncbi:MAG: glycoside hydrolase family 15 protein [Thermodesulfobacteriota bacterium]